MGNLTNTTGFFFWFMLWIMSHAIYNNGPIKNTTMKLTQDNMKQKGSIQQLYTLTEI